MTYRENQKCYISWCQEPRGHAGFHLGIEEKAGIQTSRRIAPPNYQEVGSVIEAKEFRFKGK